MIEFIFRPLIQRRHRMMWAKAYGIYVVKSAEKAAEVKRKAESAARMRKLKADFNALPTEKRVELETMGGLLAFGLSAVIKKSVERSRYR